MLLEEFRAGLRLHGLIPAEVVTVIAAQWHGTDALEVTYKHASGGLGQQVVFRKDQDSLSIAQTGSRAFDATASDFKLVAEAQRITLAGLFDPMIAVATSDVQPLPHQIWAVYGELLPRTPLRFLLADDPGAGKTIMAGLYIKELLLRDDVKQCLIVAPGGLVEQWQDELFFKFGLRFDLLTNQLIDANINLNVFETNPLLIARMDQLSRNEALQAQLKETEWDLIIVDEAHRMGAHYFGGKLEKTKRFLLGELLGQVTRHLLLMTATPHSGKEEDFQLFMTLLDRDRFEGKQKKSVDVSGVMRRMVKEDLLTFEGKKLFPERIAETVPYELTALEQDLYEDVTHYVREGMNRAEKLGGKRKNTVGFALTVLQRRLASSPEAIYKSLVRRSERLERKKQEILNGTYSDTEPSVDISEFDEDEYNAEELEQLEEDVMDAATAAQTVEELAVELDVRLRKRLELLDQQQLMSTKPPRIVTAALVLPIGMLEAELPATAPIHAKETKEVERRGVDLVLGRERELGRKPVEQAFNNPGFDILSTDSAGDTYRIEVKARIDGATDFFVTHNEVMVGKNAVPRYRLALVRVDPRGAQYDEVRYLDDPFATTDLGDFDATGIRGDWAKQWAKGNHPF